MTENAETAHTAKPKSGWLNTLVDFGPLVIFFAVYKYYAPEEPDAIMEVAAMVRGTIAFMVAALAALVFSRVKFGKASPMLWFSTALILGFGALTVFFGDPVFVQLKPTIIYLAFGIALLVGYWRGASLLKILLEAAFEGLSEEGWLKLSRNWGVFFLMLAGLNEFLRWYLDFGGWLTAKLWVFLPLSFLFTFTQIPMLLKHGLSLEGVEEEKSTIPPA